MPLHNAPQIRKVPPQGFMLDKRVVVTTDYGGNISAVTPEDSNLFGYPAALMVVSAALLLPSSVCGLGPCQLSATAVAVTVAAYTGILLLAIIIEPGS